MNQRIGFWTSDPDNELTQKLYGKVLMEFKENGDLIYHIIEDGKEQKIYMNYVIKNDTLIADQPSFLCMEITKFQLTGDKLTLYFDGSISVFLKVAETADL